MGNNSDYSKPHTDLFKMLPEVMQSDANKAVFENLFNRFLTKQETTKVSGYVGQGNPEAIVQRQIQEFDVHRQGYQLQPILYNKVGSVEWMSAWYDLLNEAERLGIDIDRLQEWLDLPQFNWAPPVDFDKIIHYQDYYWYDEANPNSSPQYITIRSRCSTATSLVTFYQNIIGEFGSTFPTIRAEEVDGQVGIYDKLILSGEYIRLFDTGFGFIYTNSTNVELNDQQWAVEESSYDTLNDETILKINTTFTNSTVDGEISITALLSSAIVARDCQCDGTLGWDLFPWDETPNNFWDAADGCNPLIGNSADQWALENKWLHRSDIPNFSIAKQAVLPIIEYAWDLEINEWVYTSSNWKYRPTSFDDFDEVNIRPPLIELIQLDKWNSPSATVIEFDEKYGNLTEYFTPGKQFRAVGQSNLLTVDFSEYQSLGTERAYQTVVTLSGGTIPAPTTPFIPDETSQGDAWRGYNIHWVFAGFDSPTPINHQVENPFVEIPTTAITQQGIHTDAITLLYEYEYSHYAQNNIIQIGSNESVTYEYTSASGQTNFSGADNSSNVLVYDIGDLIVYDNNIVVNPTEYTATDTLSIIFNTGIDLGHTIKVVVRKGNPTIKLHDLPLSSLGDTIALNRRALKGNQNVRVYVNGVRQYGVYTELTDADLNIIGADDVYVSAIKFIPSFAVNLFDDVRIEVGEAAINDMGYANVSVRTIEDNASYTTNGNELLSLVEYRKQEQAKTETNQYPLFDMYEADGTSAHKAEPLFQFYTESSADIIPAVGLRVATEIDSVDFMFTQDLVDELTNVIFAYRDYSNHENNTWVNLETNKVLFWNGVAWSDKAQVDLSPTTSVYRSPVVSANEPTESYNTVDGVYWLDTANELLMIRNGASWDEVTTALYSINDHTLQTIWKRGPVDNIYIPQKRDWDRRTNEEYDDAKLVFENSRVIELVQSGSLLPEAQTQAEEEWLLSQSNHLSETGEWVGDWEIPDPLYYNVSHENKKVISFRKLLTHFSSVIDAQPKVPGYNGPKKNMFHLISSNDVDYGVGGTIKEFNSGFDTFLSMLFINSVSPRGVIDFAHDQYEVLLNNLGEIYKQDLIELMIDTSEDSLVDQQTFMTNEVMLSHILNDNLSAIYGDTTTFTNGNGLSNWIATLPYINVIEKHTPVLLNDANQDITQILHHDGHLGSYSLPAVTIEKIMRTVTSLPDPRTNGVDTFGRISSVLPPNDTTEFDAAFATDIVDREGIYWYQVNGTLRNAYRLNLVESGLNAPSPSVPDGALWLDTTPGAEVLRIKVTVGPTVNWNPVEDVNGVPFVPGDSPIRLHNGSNSLDISTATISAWEEIDLDAILQNIVLTAENKLYSNVPENNSFSYDVRDVKNQHPALFAQYELEAFTTYVTREGISSPFANDNYIASDAFTWNYYYSVPGQSYEIIEAIPLSNAFQVEGDVTLHFNLGDPFNVKNSGLNDGYWEVSSTVAPLYNISSNLTTITVESGTVDETNAGIIYITQALPSPYTPSVPENINDGSESGGDWRDLYQKMYHTPYPHLEPWKLQGYANKPAWWDAEYLNDDSSTWGDRRWKYKHGFDIVGVNDVTETFEVMGDWTSQFFVGMNFEIDNTSIYNGTWEVQSFTYNIVNNVTSIVINTSPGGFGVNNNVASSTVEGRIVIRVGMWKNIIEGIVPAGYDLPSGTLSTGLPSSAIPKFKFVSVNISNTTITTGGTYAPDDVFPPYWDFNTHFDTGTFTPTIMENQVRSLFTVLPIEINSSSADYAFGHAGTVEWEWRNSSQYLYDLVTIAFRVDPIRLVFNIFGLEFYSIGGLLVDKQTKQVLSHSNTIFHGDIVDDGLIQFNGMNQWFINYNRYSGFDVSMSDFRTMWTGWTTPMMYQFSSFIDSASLDVAHRFICLSEFDYRVAAKRTPGVEDFLFEAIGVEILRIPPNIVRYNNDFDWEFELTPKSLTGNVFKYYDVHNYQFYADPTTDICSLYTWEISSVNHVSNLFSIPTNQTELFTTGKTFEVNGSTSNDGTYTVASSSYDLGSNVTIIDVEEDVVDFNSDGTISLNYRTLGMATGDRVTLTSHETLPIPLNTDNSLGTYEYFIVVVDDTHFKLATTLADANSGNSVDITTVGRGNHFVGKTATTFGTSGTDLNWRHYAVDTRNIKQFTPPYNIRGLQTIINVVDGYDRYTADQGWRINSDHSITDYNNPERFAGWQIEIERFLDFCYNLRKTKFTVPQQHSVTVDETTDVWSFASNATVQFITGDTVTVNAEDNVFPTPLNIGGRYYIIRDSFTDFRLADTKSNANNGIAIDITSTFGVGDLSISPAVSSLRDRPRFELNPIREGVWFRPERGIVSNLLTGPTQDIYTDQLLSDQYGRAIRSDALRVYREDKETSIRVIDTIPNDVELTSVFQDQYNYLHLSAAHLFIDTYEHVLIFNNDTSEGQLLYDPFVGLNITKFELLFNRQPEFTQRPNVGGNYLQTFFNQGATLSGNIESGVEDLRLMNDTYQVIEANPLVQHSRKSLGYEGREGYLDNLNLSAKSQFAFWRGQIQTKGSINSIDAFVNSRRFIEASVDEYWAAKVTDFGSNAEKEYISTFLSTADTLRNSISLSFSGTSSTNSDICLSGYDLVPYDSPCGFAFPDSSIDDGTTVTTNSNITLTNQTRWYEHPDQSSNLANNDDTLYFDLTPTEIMNVTISDEPPANLDVGDGWVNLNFSPGEQTTFNRLVETTREGLIFSESGTRMIYRTIVDVLGTPTIPTGTVDITSQVADTSFQQVFLNGVFQKEGDGFTITGPNEITFSSPLVGGEYVSIFKLYDGAFSGGRVDQITAGASQTIFPTVNIPTAPGFLQVFVNGIFQQESTSYVVTDSFEITFNVAVPSGADVVIFELHNAVEPGITRAVDNLTADGTGTQTVFATSSVNTRRDYQQVFVNGVLQREGDLDSYSVTGGQEITFTVAPPANADISIYEILYDNGTDTIVESSTVLTNHGSWLMGVENPIFRHDMAVDFTTLTFNLYGVTRDNGNVVSGTTVPVENYNTFVYTVPAGPDVTDIQIPYYIPLSDNIEVFKSDGITPGGIKQVQLVDYIEPLAGGSAYSNIITFTDPVPAGIEITIVYVTGRLRVNVHYEIISTNIIRFIFQDIIYSDHDDTGGSSFGTGEKVQLKNLKLWGWLVNENALNPAKIIDTQTDTVITPVEIWDPARGLNYHLSEHSIDLQRSTDPAVYTDSLTAGNTGYKDSTLDGAGIDVNPWSANEIGTTWLDDSNLGHVPYYDPYAFAGADRALLWGAQADWSSLKVYEWVSSDVPPSEWDTLAAVEESNNAIDENLRKSGKARQVLFENKQGEWVQIRPKEEVFDVVIDGSTVTDITTFAFSDLPGTPFIPFYELDIVEIVASSNSIEFNEDLSFIMKAGTKFTVSGTTNNDGDYVASSVTSNGTTTTVIITANSLLVDEVPAAGLVTFYEHVNVYVNEQIKFEDFSIATDGLFDFAGLQPADRIRIITPIPSNSEYIDRKVAAGEFKYGYDYSTDVYYDKSQKEQTTYYFWVEQKATRSSHHLSPLEAQQGIISNPNPFVFFGSVLEQQDVETDDGIITLPNRFSEAVIRGVRHIIKDDNRYIIRWTRDFTLRDELKSGLGANSNSQTYEQWELIRREQPFNIPQRLWNKVIECIVGYKLDDPTVRVPSLERELYDEENGTQTQYGIRDGQKLADGNLALATLFAYLNNSDYDFSPIDINLFFQTYDFESHESVIAAMNDIYNSFAYEHVNRIFFDVLLDGLSSKDKYEDIFKTSMIALHGVRPFQVGGLFDD